MWTLRVHPGDEDGCWLGVVQGMPGIIGHAPTKRGAKRQALMLLRNFCQRTDREPPEETGYAFVESGEWQ